MKKASFEQARHVLQVVSERNLTGRQLQQLLASGLFTDVCRAAQEESFTSIDRDAVRLALGLPKLYPDLELIELEELVIAEEATIEEMVGAGKYDEAHGEINSDNFVITHRGSRKLYLAWFKEDMSTSEVEHAVKVMDRYELARIEDLLIFGTKYQGSQFEFDVICLGSNLRSDYPIIRPLEGERYLYLYCDFGSCDMLHSEVRFLLAAKQ